MPEWTAAVECVDARARLAGLAAAGEPPRVAAGAWAVLPWESPAFVRRDRGVVGVEFNDDDRQALLVEMMLTREQK